MLCDPHNPSFAELFDSVLKPFVLVVVIALALAFVCGIALRRRPNVVLCLAIAITIGWLLYPVIPLYQHPGVRGLNIVDLATGTLAFAFGPWLASPILVALCFFSRSAYGRATFIIPLAILATGLLVSSCTLNVWTNTC